MQRTTKVRLVEPIFFSVHSLVDFIWNQFSVVFFSFRIRHERKLKTKKNPKDKWCLKLSNDSIHSFIHSVFHVQNSVKVVNNPFTVIHYGQHFSHSFVHVDDKRDPLIKKKLAILRGAIVQNRMQIDIDVFHYGVFSSFEPLLISSSQTFDA